MFATANFLSQKHHFSHIVRKTCKLLCAILIRLTRRGCMERYQIVVVYVDTVQWWTISGVSIVLCSESNRRSVSSVAIWTRRPISVRYLSVCSEGAAGGRVQPALKRARRNATSAGRHDGPTDESPDARQVKRWLQRRTLQQQCRLQRSFSLSRCLL